jgi:hypothetical protein
MKISRVRSALLGSGAAVALLAASVPATADEIDQLRAQIQQLQDKMGQLERTEAKQRRRVAPAAAVEAGAQPRSWKLPGTNTSMQIGGYARLDLIYDINAGNSPGVGTGRANDQGGYFSNWFVGPAGFADGTANAGRQNDFRLQANQSRVWIRTWTPTDWGELQTRIEGDFYGNGNTGVGILRLRHAYGQLGPVLAGQTFTNAALLFAGPETVAFGGGMGTGLGGVRQGQIRYTHSFGGGTLLSVSVEEPGNGTIVAPGGVATGATGNRPIPDFTAQLSHRWGGSMAGISGYLGKVNLNDGVATSDSAWRWLITAGAGIRFNNNRTAIGGSIRGGKGVGKLVGGTDGILNGTNATNANLDLVTTVSGHIWLQQRITNSVRMNVGYGRIWQNPTGANNTGVGGKNGLGTIVQDGWGAFVNAFWSPVSQVNFGVEYAYNFIGVINSGNVKSHRIQLSMQYNF